jgi:tetratricopeptide (TPR) repeat protein
MCRSSRIAAASAVLGGLLLPSFAIACMWDYDTIKMERTRFPGTLELITGKFLRHSPEFYQWRIKNRLKRLESDPANSALLDDLAVAYDKTGQHDKAIETALKTEKLHPGRYETPANLATFYFHAGKLTEGLPVIDKALKINPEAHFGREKYQKLLVEYVLKQRKSDPQKLPLAKVVVTRQKTTEKLEAYEVEVSETFSDFLHPHGRYEALPPDESAAAIKGILGMMKFGKHDSPVLLEALGSLLTQGISNPTEDAKFLASRAYLKASYEVTDGPARDTYRIMATKALYMQSSQVHHVAQMSVELVEPDFKRELDEGREWYEELRERELSWIREGKDPEAEFDKLYDIDPEVSGMNVRDPLTPDERLKLIAVSLGVMAVLYLLGLMFGIGLIFRHYKRRRAAGAQKEPG